MTLIVSIAFFKLKTLIFIKEALIRFNIDLSMIPERKEINIKNYLADVFLEGPNVCVWSLSVPNETAQS